MAHNILVVDDSTAIRKILIRVLRQTGLPIDEVFEARDGVEALEIVRNYPLKLILSDINMPNMDGLGLLAELKADPQWRHLPVVMITTEGSQEKVGQAIKLGSTAYIRKPFTAEQIQEKIGALLL
jgi:two-component system chemotaxis response regulator CheY